MVAAESGRKRGFYFFLFVLESKLPCSKMNCKWSRFGRWSSCSASCGTGTQERRRWLLLGSLDCSEKIWERRYCNSQVCPTDCQWSRFGKWSPCSASCGGGTQIRNRTVLVQAAAGGQRCSGQSGETKRCNSNSCKKGGGGHSRETEISEYRNLGDLGATNTEATTTTAAISITSTTITTTTGK